MVASGGPIRGTNQDGDKSAVTAIWTHEVRPQGETQDALSQPARRVRIAQGTAFSGICRSDD
jgi:hypothetical protein